MGEKIDAGRAKLRDGGEEGGTDGVGGDRKTVNVRDEKTGEERCQGGAVNGPFISAGGEAGTNVGKNDSGVKARGPNGDNAKIVVTFQAFEAVHHGL